MKIELFDYDEFAQLNKLKEVTSPIVFSRGGVPDPNGLLSNVLFGIDTRSRKNQFAYVSLSGHFFNPHVYKSFKRLYRNIERIVNGAEYYSITKDGELVKDDENGETGIEFIYENWEKIDWTRKMTEDTASMRNERINLLTKTPKNQIFIDKFLVIPVFYRDIMPNASGGGETDPLNNMYTKIIRLASMLKEKDMFDFTLHSTEYTMQNLLIEIYDHFKHKIEKKNGMIRKYLMGKNVDQCVRSVISCPLYHDDTPEDTPIKFGSIGVPVYQICSLDAPFMMNWLKSFFERNFIMDKELVPALVKDKNGETHVQAVTIYKPEIFFTDKYFKVMMDRYMHDPEYRFDPIEIPVSKDETRTVLFTGKKLDPSGKHELSNISNRPMTVTDVLYMAAYDCTRNQHALTTRYPVSDAYGLFVSKVTPIATLQTDVVQINGTVYTHYPRVDLDCPKEKIGIRFIDTLQFSNSYLAGLGGDYDGDQVTIKLLWTQEANLECDKVMNSKSFFISADGSNVRRIKFEVYQTFYDMTRTPYKDSKHVPESVKQELIKKDPKEFTFTFLKNLFADTKSETGATKKSQWEVTDLITLKAHEYYNEEACTTTIGRLCWNKVMIDRIGLRKFFPYNNEVLTKKAATKYEDAVTLLLQEDKIDTVTFRNYIDHRDWLGLQLHGLLTVSFTEKTVKTPESVKALRDELFDKYEKEIKDGDVITANKIEKQLIDVMVNEIKDDPGFDLYNSGARGDINNHLKNIFLMRGGVMNPNTGKFEIMKTSFNEGLRKEDYTPASNSVVQGAYPKAVGTADSGYLAKQLMAGNQSEVIGEDGSDCGTTGTLDFVLTKDDAKLIQRRYVNVRGNKVLLTSENTDKFIGKEIHMYSPMFCIGTKDGKLCEKCAGKQDSKFAGLDTNKIATTLTNLNMKKFHDSTLRFKTIEPDDILIDKNPVGIFTNDGTNIIVNTSYLEVYVPESYFENKVMAETLSGMINLFGLAPVGLFKNGNFDHFATLNIPSWNKYFVYGSPEYREVELPGIGATKCRVYKYEKGHKFCIGRLLEDSSNAQLMLRFVTYGKIPPTVPYNKALSIWRKNQTLNNVNFGVPMVSQEIVLASAYRWKEDPTIKFAKVIGKDPEGTSQYDYLMASIRKICQFTSTFAGITFESFDDMVSNAINSSREKRNETASPLETLFKL